jgi:hypothetical protein
MEQGFGEGLCDEGRRGEEGPGVRGKGNGQCIVTSNDVKRCRSKVICTAEACEAGEALKYESEVL